MNNEEYNERIKKIDGRDFDILGDVIVGASWYASKFHFNCPQEALDFAIGALCAYVGESDEDECVTIRLSKSYLDEEQETETEDEFTQVDEENEERKEV